MADRKVNQHLIWQDVNQTEVLCNDLREISPGEFVIRMKAFEAHVLDSGKTDIRVYSDITHTNFDGHSINELKNIATSTKKVVSKYAVIGVTGLKKILFNSIKPFATNELKAFDSVDKAKAWLAE